MKASYLAGMRWRLLAVQAGVAVSICLLLVTSFPKVPLLSACIISVVLALVGTLLVSVGIAWWRNPHEIDGMDFWRNFPDDEHDGAVHRRSMDGDLWHLPEAQRILVSLPTTIFEAGQAVLEEGVVTGQMFILQQGVVEIAVGRVPVARTSLFGAAFGRFDFAFGFPPGCDVRCVEQCDFLVAGQSSLPEESYIELRDIIRGLLASEMSETGA